jgi:two-component system response regulator AtoC
MNVDPVPLLLVEDDRAFRQVYGALLRDAGYAVTEADDRASARAAVERAAPDVVLLDLMLPPDGTTAGGLTQLTEILAARPGAKVVVVSGAGTSDVMIEAVRRGAYDFLTKPVDPDALLIVTQRAAARVALEAKVAALEGRLSGVAPDAEMVGESPGYVAAVRLAERVAASDLPVLVTGENGTGKELLARSVHRWSRRADGPFVPVNCGAIPEPLMESTFFGHARGAFTGAQQARIGLFEAAHGGTLFLDELGDMPPVLQVKVLRALESGEILPLGTHEPRRVDVRVVSATHRDLAALEASGAFREDLYWRVKGVEVHLPPLRERVADLPVLAGHFLNRAATLSPDGRPKSLSEAAADALVAHRWPGNLRELRHEMQRATVLAGARRSVEPEDLSFTGAERPTPGVGGRTLADRVEALERKEIAAALTESGGNRSRAAAALGLSRQGLLNKLTRYGLG